MAQSEIDAIRALLGSKPRPVGWTERRARIDEVGSVWPVADDVKLEPVDLDGVPGEWSMAPGSDASRVLMFFHGGGYCSGSIVSHRRMVTEAGRAAGVRTLAVGYRLAPEHPFPAAIEDALTAWRYLGTHGIDAAHIAVGGDSAGGGLTLALATSLRDSETGLAGLSLAGVALDRPDHVGRDARHQGRGRSADPQALSRRARRRLSAGRRWTAATRGCRRCTRICADCRRR